MNQPKAPISAIVLAKNEQERLEKCMNALSFCSQIILVDSGSTDNTITIAKKYTNYILIQKDADFAKLRNAAIAYVSHSWLLYIDADEIVSEALKREICHIVAEWKSGMPLAYELKRQNYYLGRQWPLHEWMSRLFHKSSHVSWSGKLHETPITDGAVARLTSPLLHHTHRSLEHMIDKTNTWSVTEAKTRYAMHHPPVTWWRFIRVMVSAFWHTFVVQGGYRAGVVGWIESIYQAFSIFITYAKLWELQQNQTQT